MNRVGLLPFDREHQIHQATALQAARDPHVDLVQTEEARRWAAYSTSAPSPPIAAVTAPSELARGCPFRIAQKIWSASGPMSIAAGTHVPPPAGHWNVYCQPRVPSSLTRMAMGGGGAPAIEIGGEDPRCDGLNVQQTIVDHLRSVLDRHRRQAVGVPWGRR